MSKFKGEPLTQSLPDMTKDKSTEPDEFQTQEDLRHVVKAHEVMNHPKRLAAVHALAGAHHKAIRSLKQVSAHYQAKYGPKPSKPHTPETDGGDDDMAGG